MDATDAGRVEWSSLVHPIFADCCKPEFLRYDLSRPFVWGGYLYASDGLIIVRAAKPADWTLANPARDVENPAWIFVDGVHRPDPVAVPPVLGAVQLAPGYRIGSKYAAILRTHGAVAHLPRSLVQLGPLKFTVGDVEGRLLPLKFGHDLEDN